MRLFLVLSACVLTTPMAHGEGLHDGYAAYYSSRPDAVFGEPIRPRDRDLTYALESEPDRVFVEYDAQIDGRTTVISYSQRDIEVNRKRYEYAKALMLMEGFAPPSVIVGPEAELFVSSAEGKSPAALCLDVDFHRSGDAGRYALSFLMLNPPGSRAAKKTTVYGIGGLFGGCRAFIRTKQGDFAFPKNGYIVSRDGARTGLRMAYQVLRGNRLTPTKETVELKFAEPENPWRFSVVSQ
jgi:hypothetical protein